MIHHQTSHPLAPALISLPRPVARIAQFVVERVLERWQFGAVELRFSNGEILSGGDPRSPDRAIVEVHDRAFLSRLLVRGELGAGESFVAGEWDSPNLVETLRLFLRNLEAIDVESGMTRIARIPARLRHRLRRNNRSGSQSNIHAHYDLGNEFYRQFLDETWTYSCAYWRDGATTLAEAQTAKLERLLGLLDLEPTDHLLEVGCGWGSLAIAAAKESGCRVTGITLSREQLELGRKRVQEAGLADKIKLRYCDYRDVVGKFDKIASVEMIEAVGYDFLDGFFAACADRLVRGGRLALQSITMPDHKFETYRRSIDWTQLYIFPGSLIPSLGALASSSSRARFDIEHVDDIGNDYSLTLAAWREAFMHNIDAVRRLGFDTSFERLWMLYLSFSEAAFAERSLGDSQILLRKRLA